ncbi:MAG: hypothetical protein V4507_04620 [Verrucomicrobiota bacterium]
MIAVTKCEKATAKKFKKAIKKYLCPKKSESRAARVHQSRKKNKKVTLGEAVVIPDTDLHHVFDADTVLAVSNAIIDLSSEVRGGDLIVSFPDFEDYSDYKAVLESIAEDTDSLRVWAFGNPPKNRKNIDFVPMQHTKLQRYHLVLFKNDKSSAVLLCRQINSTNNPDARRYVGFYSFNPYLVESIRWRFNLVTCGLNRLVKAWDNSFPLPDLRMKEIDQLLGKVKTKSLRSRATKALADEVNY